MKKIRCLLVGLGRIGSLLERDPNRRKPCTHAGTLFHPGGKRKFQLVAVSDNNPDRIREFFQDHGGQIRAEGSSSKQLTKAKVQILSDILNSREPLEGVDLGIVATNSETHYDLAKNLIDRGIPNLLIEKPVALERKQALSLRNLANKRKVRIWVNHERRFHPVYAWARDRLLAGDWGKIQTIHASVLTSKLDPGYAFSGKGGGPLLHDGTHALDYLHWLLGKPIRIQSKFTKSNPKYKVEEQALVWMEYKNGVHVFLEVGGYRKYFRFSIDIETTHSKILLGNDGFHFWRTVESPLYKGFRSLEEYDREIPKKILNQSNPFPRLYDDIYQTILEDKPVATGNIDDNLEIMDTIQKIQKSANAK